MSKLYDSIGGFLTIPNTVIERLPKIGVDAFVLFAYLRYRTNAQSGIAFPSYDTIQNDTCLTRRRIAQSIRALESNELLDRQRRFSNSTIYTLKMPPAISTPAVLMPAPISTHAGLPLVQQVHANKTYLNKTEIKTPSISRARDPIFDAIVSITQIDPSIKSAAASVGKVKRELSQAKPPYSPEEILAFGAWWNSDDWRLKNGPPACHQIIQKIGVVRNANGNGNGKHKRQENVTVYQ